MTKIKYSVAVHKADIALAEGESINQYLRRLSDAGVQHVMKKLNIAKGGYAFMCEAYGSAAVFDVSIRKSEDQPSVYKYYAVKYTRKDDGTFDFSETKEVERVTTFQPIGPLSITKADEAGPEKSPKEFLPGWVEKAFWAGVL